MNQRVTPSYITPVDDYSKGRLALSYPLMRRIIKSSPRSTRACRGNLVPSALKRRSWFRVRLVGLIGISTVSCRGANPTTEIGPSRVTRTDVAKGDSANQDSVAMLRVPRRIRGIVFDSVSGHGGVAVGNTRIRFHVASPPRIDSVTADSVGRYEVRNPAIGQLVLVAYCPSTPTWKGTVNGVVFLEVRLGIDTVVNVAVDPPHCAEPPPTQRRDTGWVNTHGNPNAKYPAGDAAAIYRVVIDHLYARDGKPPYVLLAGHTRRHCFDCGDRELFRMVQSGMVDSSTARNFEIATAEKVPLTPAFGYSAKVVLLTDNDRDYIESEEQRWSNIGQLPTGADTSAMAVFRAAFPGARDVVYPTAIGFNRARTEALVEAGKSARLYPGKTQIMLLRKANGAWHIADHDIGRLRTTGAWKGDVCVAAVSPASVPTRPELGTLSGDYELEAMQNGIRKKRYVFSLTIEPSDSDARFPFFRPGQRSRLETLADGSIKSEFPVRTQADTAVARLTLFYDGKTGFLHESDPADRMNLGPGWSFEVRRVASNWFSGRWNYSSGTIRLDESDGPRPLAVSQYFCARAVRSRATHVEPAR
jgi:hypothetical protein